MNIGIIVKDLNASQLSYLAIQYANIINKTTDNNCVIFFENISQECLGNSQVPTLDISEAWSFEGVLIATDIDQAIHISNIPANQEKVFYIWDLEWTRNKTDFAYNMKGFRSDNIKLICRSQEHQKAIANYCNITPEVVYNFNILDILTTIGHENEIRRETQRVSVKRLLSG